MHFTILSLLFEGGVYLYLVLIGITLNISLPLLISCFLVPWRVISVLWMSVYHCWSVSDHFVCALSMRMILKHHRLQSSTNLSSTLSPTSDLDVALPLVSFKSLAARFQPSSLAATLCPPPNLCSLKCLLLGSLYFPSLLPCSGDLIHAYLQLQLLLMILGLYLSFPSIQSSRKQPATQPLSPIASSAPQLRMSVARLCISLQICFTPPLPPPVLPSSAVPMSLCLGLYLEGERGG